MARGDYDDAIFFALRAVEKAVRDAAKMGRGDVGEKLMRAAFDPDRGPLTDMRDEQSERLALSHLFAGAFAYYRNRRAHEELQTDAGFAREVLVLASHLLRIVSSRGRREPSALNPA
jgi:uncharacterized protein (TIGR02391 family)